MPTLRQVLNARPKNRVIAAPGVYDMVSLRMAAAMGFDALYMTGYGTVASHLGLPDAGLASYADMVGRVEAMARMAASPLIADGDTGYGGLLNVSHTVRGYERAGAAAIQLEDQEFPKKCGHTPDRRVIPENEMVRKIAVAAEARASSDFLVIARTDARTSLGLSEAIRRARAYADAGADILFVESPETEDEMATIGRELGDKPLIANMVEGGRTPMLSNARLAEIGYALAIYPVAGLLSAAAALETVYRQILNTGSSLGSSAPVYSFADMNRADGIRGGVALRQGARGDLKPENTGEFRSIGSTDQRFRGNDHDDNSSGRGNPKRGAPASAKSRSRASSARRSNSMTSTSSALRPRWCSGRCSSRNPRLKRKRSTPI